jgi:hypothetical protein
MSMVFTAPMMTNNIVLLTGLTMVITFTTCVVIGAFRILPLVAKQIGPFRVLLLVAKCYIGKSNHHCQASY